MIVLSFGGKTPRVAESALVADTACLIGDVEIGNNTSIWPGVVIRGDAAPISIGNNCHIEENTVLHGLVTIGDNTMIGHNCVVEGKVGSGTLIANGASILYGADVGDSCLVAANAVVLECIQYNPIFPILFACSDRIITRYISPGPEGERIAKR